MNKLGRIILFIVAALLLGVGIPSMIADIQGLNALGWKGIFTNPTCQVYFSGFVSDCVNCFCGLCALSSAIFARAGFWTTLVSLIMIGIIVWYFIQANNAGMLNNWQNILRIIAGFALSIAYVIGSFLVRFRPKK